MVGEPAVECEVPAAGGSDDVVPMTALLATLLVRVPVGDADCSAPTTRVEQTTEFLTWTDGGVEHDELVAAEQRSTWTRAGDTCRVRIAMTYRGGPAGRVGTVRPCDARLLSASWASFAEVAIAVDTIAIDGIPAAAAWPAMWTDGADPAVACAPAVTIERPSLGLEVGVELAVGIEDWRRLHSTAPPVLAIRAAITVP